MTTDAAAVELQPSPDGETIAVPGTTLPVSVRTRILIYMGVLLLLLSFGGGLISIPINFFMKNKLHMSAHAIATLHIFTGIPVYLGFLFGLARDQWSPFGLGDRGYLILFGAINAVLYAAFAFASLDNQLVLLLTLVVLNCAGLFLSSAYAGLQGQIGQQHVMPGQMSTMFNVVGTIPTLASLVLGGIVSDQLETAHGVMAARVVFLIGAALSAAVAVFGLLRPKSVYDTLHAELGPKANPFADFGRLLRYWPVYPALLIWGLWSFAPGSNTPLQFYLQNTLHSNDAAWGYWNAIFAASFLPTFLLYGWLSQKYPLRPLLWIGTIIGIPQMIPMAFIHSVPVSFMAAGGAGLMGGMCTAAYTDLLIRSCPRGLQGTMLMAATALAAIAVRGGDLLGANLYDKFKNFNVCVIAITIVYASILLVLLVVPKRLTATADGETPEGGEYATQ
ncbi:MAG TPA: MFS transporter [Caulobacteraceae bacterium]|nr:MFS transporter [Caulobacteraceae bacterium]